MKPSKGTLRVFFPEKVVVEVDPELVRMTRALMPMYFRSKYNPQRYTPHITVARNEDLSTIVGSFDASEIEFEYDPELVFGDLYAWLRVKAPTLTVLRTSIGLPPSSQWSRPPDGDDCFHITVGNCKR